MSRSSSRSSAKVCRQAEPGEFDQPVMRLSKCSFTASAPALLGVPSSPPMATNPSRASASSRQAQHRTRSESRGEGHRRHPRHHHHHHRRSVFAPAAPSPEPPAPPTPPPPSASKPPPVTQPLRRQLREARRSEGQHAAFRMDLSDATGDQQKEPGVPFRESSLVRGYEALGVEIYALDSGNEPSGGTPSAPRTPSGPSALRPPAPSAMEMDLGLAPSGRLGSPAVKTRKPSGVEQSPPRSASLGTTRVMKSNRATSLSLPSLRSKVSPVVLQPFARGMANPHRVQDPLMTFSLGSSKARWGSVSAVF